MSLNKHFRIWISVVLVTGMFLVGQLLKNEEMIFPEIAAIALGAWIMDKQPWQTNRIKLFCLLSASSVSGYCISAFVPLPMEVKISLSLIISFSMLLVSKCSFFPLISASVLPIYMNVISMLYPVSVIVLGAIIIFVQRLLEKNNLRKSSPNKYKIPAASERAEHFLRIFVLIGFMAVLTCFSGNMFVLAPPLIVAFCELVQKNNTARKKPFRTFFIISLCAWFGALGQLFFGFRLHFPIAVTALILSLGVFYFMSFTRIYFPPACALTLLPLIIDSKSVPYYPLQIMLGCGILIILSIFLDPKISLKEIFFNKQPSANTEKH